MKKQMYEDAKNSDVLLQDLIGGLLESVEYGHESFINDAVRILDIIRIRIKRGDKIKDAVSGIIYNEASFQAFVEKHFSSYICKQLFGQPRKDEKAYFTLRPCEGGFRLIMAPTHKEKNYRWISGLNKHFSLMEMISTGIVYVKDNRNDSYIPFLSENGKYCRYDRQTGMVVEV